MEYTLTAEQLERLGAEARATIGNVLRALGEVETERDLLRSKLTAHHELSTLSSAVVRAWGRQVGSECPVCKEVEDEASDTGP